MIDERLDGIAPATDDRDLIEYLEGQLQSRQHEIQTAVAREMAARNLLLECRRAASGLPAGQRLTVATFLPAGLDPLARATREVLIDAYSSGTRIDYDEGGEP